MSEAKTETWYFATSDFGIKEIQKSTLLTNTFYLQGILIETGGIFILPKSGFFPTWQEAHAFLAERALKRVQSAENELRAARANLEAVRALQEPKDGDK